MKKGLLIVALIVTVSLVGCSEQEKTETEGELVKTVNVETQTVQPSTFQRYLQLVGTVESDNDVRISAEVSGRIERYYARKGARIGKGAAILKVDDSKLQREQARLQAQTEQAKERYQRLKRVFEQDSIGAEIDVINAKTTYEERKAALESVEVDLRNTTVRAPFNATIDEKLLEEGEMASPGAALVRLIGSENLKVVAGVPSRYSNAISRGDSADVWFDFQDADTLTLPISFVSESINKDARTFKVEINLPSGTENYKVDMAANVKLRTFRQDSAIVVSEEYIYQKENRFVVYTTAQNSEGNSIASQQVVEVGPSYENRAVVEQGLRLGEELITVGSSFLQDSIRIQVVNERSSEIAENN